MTINIPAYSPQLIRQERQFFGVNSSSGELQIVNSFDEKQAQKVLGLFTKALQEHRSGLRELEPLAKHRLIETSDLYVRVLADRYRDKLSQNFSKARSDPFLMSIAKLDRFVTSEKFSSLHSERAIDPERVKLFYSTPLSGGLLDKWLSESTHEARKAHSALPNEKLVHSEYAAEAFLRNPEEIDFLTESYTHKQMSRLSEQVVIDPVTKHHRIRSEGSLEDVSSLISRFVIKNKKIYAIAGDHRYFFCQDKGLTQYDPENWTTLPVFRKRKHAAGDDDYRLVLKTIINEKDDDKHSWIELKTPDGVYNVGYFWDDQDSLSTMSLCKTLRGKLHAVDKNELLGKEQFIQKTVSKISKEQFEQLKAKIEAFQNKSTPKMFNLINSSCSSWTRNILQTVDLDIASKENGTRLITGNRFEYHHQASSLLGKIERCWHTFASVIRNLFIYILSGSKAVLPRNQFDVADLPFRSFLEIFDTRKGFFDYPKRIREWQDAVSQYRVEEVERVRSETGFSLLSQVEQTQRIDAARYALPTKVTLPEPVVAF
ncbi:MAG: hypothetical protein NTX49_10495 [Chlamydiae bacterium]|nr:hypothetical protein [Chlamydiota bacterium]